MRTRFIGVSGIALTALVLIGSGYANVIFTSDNLNIGLGNVDVPDGPTGGAPLGTALDGTIASAGRTVAVKLTSDSDKLIGSGGSGNVCRESCTPARLPIRNVTLELPGFGFTHMVLNPHNATGDLTYTVFTCRLMGSDLCVEEPQPFTTTVAGRNGQNFMSITADAFSSCGQVPRCVPGIEVITRVTLDAPSGFNTLNQIRISNGVNDIEDIDIIDAIPEPSSMLLLGSGLLVFTQVLRRKLKLGFWTRSA